MDQTDEATHVLSADIGGTFTDFSLLDLRTSQVSVHKVLTDAETPARTVMQGATELLKKAGVAFGRLLTVVHSTTLSTNAIIERKGAKTALITTQGFRDVLETGREQIYDMYDLQARFPEPLVPRYLRREVSERVNRDGQIHQRPGEAETLAVADELTKDGMEAVAICLLHSYKNPTNERMLKTLLESRFPDLILSLSSEVSPVINEYERTSTTVIDSYLKPSTSRYLHSLEAELAQAGFAGQLLVMHSAGGLLTSERAREHPVRLLESGPAAGALAASFYGELIGKPDLISLDMGGTTAKTCVIEAGKPTVANSIEVARVHRFKIGSGLPVVMPVLDMIEIGAGGGSIAWLDNLGLLKIGPRSAGARPGPACYGNGGVEPTVTDANLALGYLNPEYFLGGRMKLFAEKAKSTISGLAQSMSISEIQAAWGIFSVVCENMAAAARIHIIGRNKDPRNYAIVAFGGAGPAHACEVARALGVKQVIAPLAAGVTSAIGCITAPLSFEGVRSLPAPLTQSDWDNVNQLYREMEHWGTAMLQDAGELPDQVEFVRSADMQLEGQIHEINVPIPDGPLGPSGISNIEESFHQIYQELYSRKNFSVPIEVQNWRLLVRGPVPSVRIRHEPLVQGAEAREALKDTRPAFFQAGGGFVDCPVYDRYRLRPGSRVQGPAIVEEEESTAVIGPQDEASVDQWLNLVIDVG